MVSEEILKELDIEEGERFCYFEQFAALMETPLEFGFETFAELMAMADQGALGEMVYSFFEDIMHGVPDDNTTLYSALEIRRSVLEALAQNMEGRNAGILTDELYTFREWFLDPETVLCTPEGPGGRILRLSPCEAMILYREEKLSGAKYDYDFSNAVLPEISEYVLSLAEEAENTYGGGSWEDDVESLPDELPPDFDIDSYIPGETDLSGLTGGFDPYRDGFIDRFNPVIDGMDYED